MPLNSLPPDQTASGPRAGARRASRGIAGCGRLEGHGSSVTETASSETDCTRDSAPTRPQIGIARLSEAAQSGERDAVSRVPRGWRQRVRALSPVRGGRGRQSLARERDAVAHRGPTYNRSHAVVAREFAVRHARHPRDPRSRRDGFSRRTNRAVTGGLRSRGADLACRRAVSLAARHRPVLRRQVPRVPRHVRIASHRQS